ncbi:MAG: hypothetical protein R3F35_19770 [Myxococcota bacterium]
MRPHQIFAAMSQEKCGRIMEKIAEQSPEAVKQTVAAAAIALKFRPQFLLKQPVEMRVSSVRRALSRTSANALAEELLAVYFLKCRLDLLGEWLDLVGLEHEEGILKADVVPSPPEDELREKVARFLGAGADDDRPLLLEAFAAQTAVQWPVLDALVEKR